MSDAAVERAADLERALGRWRSLIDDRLERLIVPASVPELDELAAALRYSLLAPGKRIRPALVLAATEACGGAVADAVDVACAFELIHTYSLVHDDLPCMDDDDMRRGMPTSHRAFGEGVAVLVGDALQTRAFELLADVGDVGADQRAMRLEIVGVLARASGWMGMVGGQHLDITQRHDGDDRAALRTMHDRKTGALISGAVEAGAIVAGASADTRAACARFGHELGWLFQLVDDMLDEVSSSEVLGKPQGSDARQDKVTALQIYGGIDGLAAAADLQLDRCMGAAGELPRGGSMLPSIARYVRHRTR